MKRSTDRILTSHVGSLIRTPEIIEGMRLRTTHRPYDAAKLDADIVAGVKEVTRKQHEAGVDVPSDGEYSKPGFGGYNGNRIKGYETRPRPPASGPGYAYPELFRDFPGFMEQYNAMFPFMWLAPGITRAPEDWRDTAPEQRVMVAKISYDDTEVKQDIATFKAAMQGLDFPDAFIPCTTPPSNRPNSPDVLEVYPNEDDYLHAMADVMGQEYKAITDAGLNVQLDLGLPARTNASEQARKNSQKQVEMINYALRNVPMEQVRYHLCWGSMNTPHHYDIPLREVVDIILGINAQAYSLEAANPRHEHEWMVWKDVKLPEGKVLIPGIVSHQTNVVEHPELVAWRIENYASVIGRENVIAGTDCGFSQNFNWARVHPEVQWAKLRALADGAALASKKLWSR